MAAGATYLVGKDLEMSNSGLDILKRVEHLLPQQQVPATVPNSSYRFWADLLIEGHD